MLDSEKLYNLFMLLSDKLKVMEKSIGDNRRNVGNYAESVKDGILQTQGLTGGTGALV